MEEPKVEKSNNRKRKEDKVRRRDNRSLENVMQAIGSEDQDKQLTALKERYQLLYSELTKLHCNYTGIISKVEAIGKERDQYKHDYNKAILARSRMESLCRELQKQNKAMKEENFVKIKEEEELRKEATAKFQTTLNELTAIMQENSEKNLKLRDDNIDMANKIASLCQEFEKGQQDISRMEKQMSLEKQLSEATLTKVKFELMAEREQNALEKSLLQKKLLQSEEIITRQQADIKQLEHQLQMYTGKYEEFETTISKSNKVFDSCKSEMTKMTKQITFLENELKTWKSRWETNATLVIELSDTKQKQEADITCLHKKIDQLQRLCRQVQVDRAAFLKLLKSNGIEPTSQICTEPSAGAPTCASAEHLKSSKSRELNLLKSSLSILQEQLAGYKAKQGKDVKSEESPERTPTEADPKSDEAPINGVVTDEGSLPESNDATASASDETSPTPDGSAAVQF